MNKLFLPPVFAAGKIHINDKALKALKQAAAGLGITL